LENSTRQRHPMSSVDGQTFSRVTLPSRTCFRQRMREHHVHRRLNMDESPNSTPELTTQMTKSTAPTHARLAPIAGLVGLLALIAGIVWVVVAAPWSQAALPKGNQAPSGVAGLPTAGAQPQAPGQAQAGTTTVAANGDAMRLSNSWGVDISWPQCGVAIPSLPAGFVTVGVNGGRPFSDNPCLAQQIAYAKQRSGYAAYLNLSAPRGVDPTTYGRQSAIDGLHRARAAGLHLRVLWLDVEVLNHWSADPAVNVAVINGAVSALHAHGVTAGVYSSTPMWQQITGGAAVNMPVWLATSVIDYRDVQPLCREGLGGHPAVMAQYVAAANGQLIDVDVLCNNALPDVVRMFRAGG